jgi:hypothetical protein
MNKLSTIIVAILSVISLNLSTSCKNENLDEEVQIGVQGEALFKVQINASQGGNVNTSGGSYPINTQIEITATPNDGFEFTGWSGNASSNENPLSYTVVGNADITANFGELVTYSLTLSSTLGGSINTASGEYAENSLIQLVAEPDDGYEFVSWTQNSNVISNESTFVYEVQSESLLIANFRQITSINFANSSVSPSVNGFNAYSDILIQGDVDIISKGIYLDGQIITEDSIQSNTINIEGSEISIQEYNVVFFVQTSDGFVESSAYTVTPYEAGYNFSNLSHSLNEPTTSVDLSVQYIQKSTSANINILEQGFLISTNESSLGNNRILGSISGNTLQKQINDLNISSTYYYQAFVENEYGLFKSEIETFNTKAVLGGLAQGGIIVEVDASGFHGKVVTSTDYWVRKQWSTESCGFNDLITRFDDGLEATEKILSFHSSILYL